MSDEAKRLRDQAERCLRLARSASDKTMIERLTELAAEYLEQAQALEGAPAGSQGPVPPPQDQATHQRQQAQPKDDDTKE